MATQSAADEIGATNVVILTPPGRAAVAVVLVAGPDALGVVSDPFQAANRRALADIPVNRIALGRWGGADGEEIVVCRRSPEQIEIHCHGGSAAVNAIVERLIQSGCHQISWTDWLRQSSGCPIHAEAQIALANAPTASTAAILLDQLHGALAGAVHAAAAALAAGEDSQAAAAIDAVLAQQDLGRHLTTAWRVVLVGPPNVGKSSLINALAGYERTIVSQIPGTTRDVVTTTTAIEGWPVQLADTAGLRASDNELEAAGIALATAELSEADLVLVVQDVTQPEERNDMFLREIAVRLRNEARLIVTRNKIDLFPAGGKPDAAPGGTGCASAGRADSREHWRSQWHPSNEHRQIRCDPIAVSALTGAGVGELIAAIGRVLVPDAPPPGAAVPFTAHQIELLTAARAAIAAQDRDAAQSALQSLLSSGSG